MRIAFIAAAVLVSVGLVVPCSAQSVCEDCAATFALNSSFTNGGTIDGTLTLNELTNTFTGADLTVSGFPSYPNGTLTDVGQQGDVAGGYGINITSGSLDGGDLYLVLFTSSLVGFDGSPISAPTTFSTDQFAYNADEGTLTPAAVTPEPASLVLLATGLLGFAAFWRRRFVL